jgi:sugar phosphate isomerase/epimerase
MSCIKHSITYYGFGQKWRKKEYTFENLFEISVRLGGDGIEIVPVQMTPDYPNPTDAWVERFKELCAQYRLQPVCYSVYIDNGMHFKRVMTEDERIAWTVNDMEFAKRMGFSIVRSQHSLMPETLEKLLPYCEELGIHLAPELHGPHVPSTPVWQEYLNLFEKKNSDYIGVVTDFSSFNSAPPVSFLNTIPDDICHKELLMQARDIFESTEQSQEEIIDFVMSRGGNEADKLIIDNRLFSGIGHYLRTKVDYDGFERLLKYSKYMHGKFYYVSENLESKGINYPEFVKRIKRSGFDGYIASEYEGTHFDPDINDEEQISRHIKMLKKLWAEA